MKNYFKIILLMAILAIFNSCTYHRSKDVKNVIYLIGDGMGVYQTRLFEYLENGEGDMLEGAIRKRVSYYLNGC